MSLAVVEAQNKIVIPDTENHLILTGDMHLHTVFSDGNVWPNTRVDEAYSEGVEGVSYENFIHVYPFETDHISCCEAVYKAPITFTEINLSFDIENFFTAPGKQFNYKMHITL